MSYKILEETISLMRTMHNEGKSVQEITEKAGVCRTTLHGYIRGNKLGFSSPGEYLEIWARDNGFPSHNAYSKHMTKIRQERSQNKLLGSIIKGRLRELERSQKWLAEQMGVNPSAVSFYVRGYYLPREELQKKLFETLDIPCETIDDLLAGNFSQ